jgi:alanyl-tRNA synthetase
MEYDELEARPEVELRVETAVAAELVLDETPFYAEGGGQIGDRGVIRDAASGRMLFTVEDTQRPVAGLIVHRGRLHGRVAVGQAVNAEVDADRRARTMRNHTGTHVLHRALRNAVGEQARQAGSLVTPEYLRFDYPADRPLSPDERRAIEAEVRRVVREDLTVTARTMSMAEAVEAGADAFFDEKYGEHVRTIAVDGYSLELCGGTHCRATGQIGGFIITGERSIGAGMRRIEAVTGEAAEALTDERFRILDAAVAAAGAQTPEQLPARVEELKRQRAAVPSAALPSPAEIARAAIVTPRGRLVEYLGDFPSAADMKAWAKDVRSALGSGVIAAGTSTPDPQLFVTVSDDLVAAGLDASDLVREAVGVSGGRGGGRPEMAQGRTGGPDGLERAMETLRERLQG